MTLEPIARQCDDAFERAGFFEQMCRPWYDLEPMGTFELRQGLFIEFDDAVISPADDQQRRRPDTGQMCTGKIGPSAA